MSLLPLLLLLLSSALVEVNAIILCFQSKKDTHSRSKHTNDLTIYSIYPLEHALLPDTAALRQGERQAYCM
jgi:hypothetical protein